MRCVGGVELGKAVQKVHSQVYAWAKKYELVTFKGSNILIFKGGADGDSETLALDQAQVVSHHGRVFEDLLKIHIDGGHCKAKTFLARIKIAHGKSIPRWAAEAFVNHCPSCVRRLPRKPSSAGHKPILTKGLGSRGQVDLIDFQSCPDGSFKFLLNYQDHGIKFHDNRALTSKRNDAIAFALLDIFTVYGAPAILQSDNGREFTQIAHTNKSKTLEITDDDLDAIITEIASIWPACKMVRGRPRHSQSQGSVERLNRTSQTKLGFLDARQQQQELVDWAHDRALADQHADVQGSQ